LPNTVIMILNKKIGGKIVGSLLSIVLVFAVFYFFLIRPEQMKQKKFKSMLDSLKVGNKVITRGGIYGEVVSIDGDTIVLATGPNNVQLAMSKHAVASILEEKEQEVKEKADVEQEGGSEEKAE
jgi:preprotein translocase subunit YajC